MYSYSSATRAPCSSFTSSTPLASHSTDNVTLDTSPLRDLFPTNDTNATLWPQFHNEQAKEPWLLCIFDISVKVVDDKICFDHHPAPIHASLSNNTLIQIWYAHQDVKINSERVHWSRNNVDTATIVIRSAASTKAFSQSNQRMAVMPLLEGPVHR